MEKEIYLEPIKVAFTNSFGHPSTSDAFKRLEEVVPLRGNKFYATYDSQTGEYCACAEIEGDMRDIGFSLSTKTIAGGWYVSTEIRGEFSEIIKRIGPLFDELAKKSEKDESRLPIEYYKRHTHVVLYLPVIASLDRTIRANTLA